MTSTLVWPDGTVYTIVRSTEQTHGAELEMEWRLPARGWAPRPHVHPSLTEEYEVLDVRIGRTWHRLGRGQRASVPPGTVHVPGRSTARAGPERAPSRARSRGLHPPAVCDGERAQPGRLRGLRALLHIAVLVSEHPEHSRAAGRALDGAAPRLAALARLVGVEPAARVI